MTEANGLPNCGDCIYACEHVNIKGSPCYDCKHRNKFIKAVEQNSSEPDFDKMPIEKINQYLREHGYDPEKVGLRGQILAEALTKNIIAREIIQRLLADPGGCRFCDFGVLRKPDNPLKGHDENCPYLAAHAYLDNETSTVVKRELSDAQINELGAELKITDELLKEATETIGAVVACCTYNSNDDAKIGIYGIDQKAFTRIDQFITHYNDAVSAGKVSVDVKRELTDAEIEELGAQEAERLELRKTLGWAYDLDEYKDNPEERER